MQALLGWCCGVKTSLREASSKATERNQQVDRLDQVLGKRIFNRIKSKEARGIQSQRICNIFAVHEASDTFVYSEGGVAVPISKDASDLLNRFAGSW